VNRLSGWGRLAVPGRELLSEDFERITRDVPLSRGLGRSYGDSSLPPPDRAEVAGSRLADRVLGFDPESGLLHAEAGFSLFELNRIFLPRGWASPVLTGTQYVTLGGMAAADVHGKNHHVDGTFGAHVERLRLRLAAGRVVSASRGEEPDHKGSHVQLKHPVRPGRVTVPHPAKGLPIGTVKSIVSFRQACVGSRFEAGRGDSPGAVGHALGGHTRRSAATRGGAHRVVGLRRRHSRAMGR